MGTDCCSLHPARRPVSRNTYKTQQFQLSIYLRCSKAFSTWDSVHMICHSGPFCLLSSSSSLIAKGLWTASPHVSHLFFFFFFFFLYHSSFFSILSIFCPCFCRSFLRCLIISELHCTKGEDKLSKMNACYLGIIYDTSAHQCNNNTWANCCIESRGKMRKRDCKGSLV